MFETEWTLTPLLSGYSTIEFPNKAIGTPYYEQILVSEENFPFAVIHIDTFWTRYGENKIYDALKHSNKIKVKVTFEVIDEDY